MRKTNSSIKSAKRPTQFSASRQRLLFALLTFSSLTSGAALAAGGSLPTGGHFVGGNGAITQGGNHLSVSQSSQTGIINWQSFSIGKGDSVTIANGKGATLNRVTGGNISTIAGSLKSTGSVYVVNQAGVVVGPSGKVVTNGTFVASTRDVSNTTFMAGGNVDLSGSSSGTVVNQGSITSTDGNVVLVGKSVSNSGSVSAAKGSASLVAGDNVLLQASGDDAVLVETGSGNVANSGTVEAAQVALNAAGGNVYALAVNNGGVIRATGTATKDGRVYLTAGDDLTVNSTVVASNADGAGGTIVATGSAVKIGGKARIQANGSTDGGTILLGGDRHGGTDPSVALSKTPVANAKTTTVAAGAQISANAGGKGSGGHVVVWSDDTTTYHGAISAKGGSALGDGGFVEVSGKGYLAYAGTVSTASAHGKTGTLLLDPSDVTIVDGTGSYVDNTGTVPVTVTVPTGNTLENKGTSGGTTTYTPTGTGNTSAPNNNSSYILNSDIQTALASNDVVITTSSSGTGAGNILVAAPITWSQNHSLTLTANGYIKFAGDSAAITTTGTGNITLNAAGDDATPQFIGILIGAPISANGGTISINATDPVSHHGAILIARSTDTVTNTTGDINLTTTFNITTNADVTATGGNINLVSTGNNSLVVVGNGFKVQTTGTGSILLQGDEVTLGSGGEPNQTGRVITDTTLGKVTVQPSSAGNIEVGTLGASPILVDEDLSNITTHVLVIGSDGVHAVNGFVGGNTTGITIADNLDSNSLLQLAEEDPSHPVPVPLSTVGNLHLLSTGFVTENSSDGNFGLTVKNGNGGLAITAGTYIDLNFTGAAGPVANQSVNHVGTLALDLTGTGVAVPAGDGTNSTAAIQFAGQPSSGSLTIGTVDTVSGITATGVGTVYIADPGAVVQAAGAANKITATSLDVEGGTTGTYTLGNTSNSVGSISGNVSTLSFFDSTALTQTNGTTLTATGTGTGTTNAAVRIVDKSDITLNTGSTITDTAGGDIQLETDTKFSSSATDANTLSVAGSGAWRVYSQSPLTTGERKGALVDNYIQYDAVNSDSTPFLGTGETPLGTGNGFLYTFQPTVTGTVTATRAYNANTTAASGILVFGSSPSGVVAGDTVTLTGSTGTFNSKDVVSATTVTVTNATVATETALNPNGDTIQVFNYAVNATATGTGTITPIPLTITAGDQSKTYGQTKVLGTSMFSTGTGQLVSGETISSVTLTSPGTPATANAGNYAITPSAAIGAGGFLASNYSIDFVNGTLTVNQAPLTFTPKAVSVTYDGGTLNNTTYSDILSNYTISGFQNSDTLGNSGLVLTGSMAFNGSTGTAVKSAATYTQAVGTLSLTTTSGNYSLSFSNPTPNNYVITPAALTVTPNAVSVAYDGTTLNNTIYSDNTGNYTITGFVGTDTLGNSGLTLTGSMAFGGSTGTAVKNVATYSQTVGTLGLTTTNGNYTLSFSNPTPNNYVITPLAITVTAGDQSKTYGQLKNLGTSDFTVGSGLVSGETITSVTLTSAGTPASANAGAYDINGSAATGSGGFLAANYTITYDPGTLTVSKAALTFTPKAVSIAYDGSTLNNTTYSDILGNYTISGFQNSDTAGNSGLTLTGSMAFNGLTGTAVKNAATYSQGVGTLSLTSANYTLTFANPTPNNYVITPAALTITANDQTKTYGQTGSLGTTAFTTGSGLVSGETISSVTLTSAGTPAAANTGDYAIGISNATGAGGFLASNYDITYTPGTLTVNPAVLTVTPVGVSKVFDGSTLNNTTYSDDTGNYTITGFVNGQNLTSAGIGLTGSMAFNNSTTTVVRNAGTYSQKVGTLALTSDHGNYTLAFSNPTPNNYVITPLGVTVADLQGTRIYDGGTDAAGSILTITDLAAGDHVTITGSGVLASKNVGKEQITGLGTLALGGADAGNYTLEAANPNDFVIVTKATLTVSAVTQTKVYDGTATSTLTPTIVGLQTGDSITGTKSQSYGSRDVLGTNGSTLAALHDIGVSDGNGGGNYTIVYKTAKGTITPEHVTVTATPNTKTFDGTDTATALPTVTAGTIFNPDTGTFTESYNTKHAGTGLTLTPTGSISDGNDGNNYIITFVPISSANPGPGGKAGIITPAPLTISAVTQTKVYDGTTTSTETPVITSGELVDGDTLTGLSQAYNSKNVLGANGSTLSVNPNYVLTDASDYAITLKTAPGTITPLAITATGTRVYNGTPDVEGSILTITDLAPGDDVGLTGTGTSSSPHVGTHDVTGGLTLTGTDAGNYTLTGGKETVKITSFAVVLTGTRVYDGATDGNAGILSVTNAFAGDTVTVDTGTSTIVNRNVGNEKIVDFGTLTLGGASAGDYTLVGAKGNVIVTPELLTVTAVPGTKTYDGTLTSTGKPIVTVGTVFGPDTGTFIQTYGTKHAGTGLTLTPSGSVGDGNGGKNYIITFVPVTTGVINPLPVILAGTRVFDSQTDANSAILAVTNLIPGNMVTVTGDGVLSSPNVGLEPIVGFTGLTLDGPSSGDYTLVGAIGNVQVTPLAPPPPPPVAPLQNPSLQVPDQTASGNGTQVTFSVFSGGLVTLAPQQNGVVTGTIATIDGTDYQPDSQLGCTLGAAGCIQNGVAPTTTSVPAQ